MPGCNRLEQLWCRSGQAHGQPAYQKKDVRRELAALDGLIGHQPEPIYGRHIDLHKALQGLTSYMHVASYMHVVYIAAKG